MPQKHDHRDGEDDGEQYNTSKLSEQFTRHSSYNHHEENGDTQEHGCRHILEHDGENHNGADCQDVFECPLVSSVLVLHGT